MILLIAEMIIHADINNVWLSNSDEKIPDPNNAVMEASIKPVTKAERNKALSVV